MAGGSTFSWRAVVMSALLGGLLGYVMFAHAQQPDAEPRAVTTRPGLYPDEADTVSLFKANAPSCVYITATKQARDAAMPNATSGNVRTGTGSGVVWDDAGHIVTNFHVIGDFDTAVVRDVTGKESEADVVGVSPENDLAVLKVKSSLNLRPIQVGTSADLQVGQRAYAIGNPFGLDHTLTTGIVSAVDRSIPFTQDGPPVQDLIQTDAAINPGNSGGPLLDSAGRLIGVNAAVISPNGVNAGIGFAVAVDTVNRIVPQLIKTGRGRPSLGLIIDDGTSRNFQRYNNSRFGVVARPLPGSSIEAAGWRPPQLRYGRVYWNDVLLNIDGTPVASASDVDAVVNLHKPGDTVTLTYLRDGEVRQRKVMLDSSMKQRTP